jgi:ATP-dependent RNA circularization protein (DNA/RNA ligase family)
VVVEINKLPGVSELIGPGVQSNIYKLKDLDFRVFTMYNIEEGKYFSFNLMSDVCESMGIKTVPLLYYDFQLPPTVDSLLEFAEGQSQLAPFEREGLVFRNHDRSISFKVISNKYLVKKDAR